MERYVKHGRILVGRLLQAGRASQNGRDLVRVCSGIQRQAPAYGRVHFRGAASTATADMVKPDMFCYQCEQTKSRRGCVTVGVCGKTPEVASLQDLLMYTLQGLSMYANRAAKLGILASPECDAFIQDAMFSTLTNVNFDPERFSEYVREAVEHRDHLKSQYETECAKQGTTPDPALNQGPASWEPESYDVLYLDEEGRKVGVLDFQSIYGPDVNGVRYMTIYGIRGLSAYSCHANKLGEKDPAVSKFMYETLDFLASGDEAARHDLGVNLELALKVGEINLRVMELLDKGHRRLLGTPSPCTVSASPKPGKCILVSGHDLMDLYTLLERTEGTDINVYTHGEMLPAHSYPKLREFKSLAGQFGGAWQNQKIEFGTFPGPVVVTTNCVIEPFKSYKDRLYTLNETGITGVKHMDLQNPVHLDKLIEHAESLPGFTETGVKKFPEKTFTVGFGREVILEHAEQVLNAVQTGDLRRIFVIGGCDGSEHKRNYFATLAKSLPPQTLILTMGCAKYRINTFDYGTLGSTGIPRLLDMGQCNDSYGAVMVAKALADALDTDINSLPLSLSLSWFEQKAVAVLLSLLSLGVKNIRLGPVMPAFLTPNVRQALEEKFGIVPVDIRHPVEDMEQMMKG